MRRRQPDVIGALPAELVDSALWPMCARYDGGEQRCVCWWAQKQHEYVAAGNEWPGGDERVLADLLEMHTRFPCNEPFDGTLI